MEKLLEIINAWVWGIPTMIMILSAGLYLTLRTGFVQLRLFPKALSLFISKLKSKNSENGTSSYQAFCTALAATVGTGNLAGVAGAIAIGGPGAVFWMWICAFLGMATKYAEAVLSVRYRRKDHSGNWVSGPMYVIRYAMGNKWKFMAFIYAFLGVIAAFGVGNATQVNTIVGSANVVLKNWGVAESIWTNLLLGFVLALLLGSILLGGANRIGSITEKLVPAVSAVYVLLCLGVLIVCADKIPEAFSMIVKGAFTPRSVTGGIVGSCLITLRTGMSRGVFTNEAGMGTAGIAHGEASVEHPVEQGLMGVMEVFIDTIVICTLTALVILCSGAGVTYGKDEGIALTSRAFSAIYGDWASAILSVTVIFLAIATILGWGLYGARCAQFIFGEHVWKRFCYFQILAVFLGAILRTGTVWIMAEIVNGLMTIPNIISLWFLSKEVTRLTKVYKNAAPKMGQQGRCITGKSAPAEARHYRKQPGKRTLQSRKHNEG